MSSETQRSADRTTALAKITDAYRTRSRSQRRKIVRLLSLVAVILLWELMGQAVPNVLFAPFSDVFSAYIQFVREGQMYATFAGTLLDMLFGFALTAVVGIPLGIIIGRSYLTRRLMVPWLSAFFVVATATLLPLFIVAFGLGFNFRIVIVFFSAIFHITLNVYSGAMGIEEDFVDVGQSFNATRLKQFRSITLPATLPFIISGLRMGLARSLLGIILAEIYIFSGYGGMILEWSQQSADTAPVLALILNIMIAAYVLRNLMTWVQVRLAPWSDIDVD